MHALPTLLLIAGAVMVAALARRFRLSAPLLLVVVGLVASLVLGAFDSGDHGGSEYELDPELVLVGFLPPLLYAAALESSWLGLRQNARPVVLLSVGLVLFTTATVGAAAYLIVPGLGLAAALALGAIVAPPDAVAATAVAREAGLPRRMLLILAGESLVNDATALTAYRVAVAAAAGGTFSLLHGTAEFVQAAVGGLLIGAVVAVLAHEVLRRLQDPLLENTVSLLVPFIAFLPAEEVHASGVLSVVVAGLYIGHRAPKTLTFASRLQAAAVWRVVGFLLESVVFLLIGLQLRSVLEALSERSVLDLLWYTVVVNAVVIVGRFVWVFPATYLPRRISRRVRERDPAPPWQAVAVLGWAGMRGVVSLAAAFARPTDFPQRDLIVFLTFTVVLTTLLLQGSTLTTVIRRLGVAGDDSTADRLAQAQAAHAASRAARERLDELVADQALDGEVVERLRQLTHIRSNVAWERLGRPEADTPSSTYRRLRISMLEAERETYLRLRDEGVLDDELLRESQQALDLEEALLSRD